MTTTHRTEDPRITALGQADMSDYEGRCTNLEEVVAGLVEDSGRLERIEAKLDKLIATLGEPFSTDPENSIAVAIEDINATVGMIDFHLGHFLGYRRQESKP